MTIIQLTTFLKIAETKNFTTAAEQLGYAQSTVTMQIKQLEDELGCPLFERLGKKIVLTPEGEKLVGYAQKVVQLEREILTEVPSSDEPNGVLNIGVSESLCYSKIPDLLMKYKKKYPAVEIRLKFIMHDTFPEMLRRGSLDIAYTLNPDMDIQDLNRISSKREQLGFYVSPEHPLARKRAVYEADLEGVPLLISDHDCSFRQMLLDDLADKRILTTIALETSSKEILKQFAARGLGVAFVPDMAAKNEVKEKKLKRLRWKGEDLPVYSQVFVHKDKHINKAMEAFLNLIQKKDKEDITR